MAGDARGDRQKGGMAGWIGINSNFDIFTLTLIPLIPPPAGHPRATGSTQEAQKEKFSVAQPYHWLLLLSVHGTELY